MASQLTATKQYVSNFFVITDLGALGESSQFGTAIRVLRDGPKLQPAFLRFVSDDFSILPGLQETFLLAD
jgi:hypothetical protein